MKYFPPKFLVRHISSLGPGRHDFPRHLVLIPANERELPLLTQPYSWNSNQRWNFQLHFHHLASVAFSIATIGGVCKYCEKKNVPYEHLTTWASRWMCASDNVNNGVMVDTTLLSLSIKEPWSWRSEIYLKLENFFLARNYIWCLFSFHAIGSTVKVWE